MSETGLVGRRWWKGCNPTSGNGLSVGSVRFIELGIPFGMPFGDEVSCFHVKNEIKGV